MDKDWGYFIDVEKNETIKDNKNRKNIINNYYLQKEKDQDRLCCIYVFYGNICIILTVCFYCYFFM